MNSIDKDQLLLQCIKDNLPQLMQLAEEINDRWMYEDGIYRFYHQSFKVYHLQEATQRIVSAFQRLAPHLELNRWFLEIVRQGTGKEFTMDANERWTEETRPIVEAFFHARFFLEMVCEYGQELDKAPTTMPSGWAAVLYLYRIR